MEEYSKIVNDLRDIATNEFKSGNVEQAIVYLEKAWEELPETKFDKPESFLIGKAMIFILKKEKRYEEALIWARKLMQSDLERHDSGDREFTAATVLYHLERKDDAWKYFDVANDKSEGRCFLSSDKEYLKFFKSRQS